MAKASDWLVERNERARARLDRVLPEIFPSPVLVHALQRRFTPPTPRLAVDSYWRAHPLRADRLARGLAARSGAPPGWSWRIGSEAGLAPTFRAPPLPYRDPDHARGAGGCCVCGQPVYRLGWHLDLWNEGANRRVGWHAACVAAWQFWNAPSSYRRVLKRAQRHRCAATGKRLLRSAEVDHRTPLFEVWRRREEFAWPSLLAFWGTPNLHVINRECHVAKSAIEARSRGKAGIAVAAV